MSDQDYVGWQHLAHHLGPDDGQAAPAQDGEDPTLPTAFPGANTPARWTHSFECV